MIITKIEKLNHQGEGIAHLNRKIVFIPNSLPNETIEIKIIADNKKFSKGKIINIEKNSPDRITPSCPYFERCGGCSLMHMSYEKTLNFKETKVREILKKYSKIDNIDINIIENKNRFNYRNKIFLKIKNGKIGYYQVNTNKLIEIDKCLIASTSINTLIQDLKQLKLKNGNILIRSNYNNELILIINDLSLNSIDIEKLKINNKIVGVILNDRLLTGKNYFIEKNKNNYYQVSYNSFFQVNNYITGKMIEIVNKHLTKEDIVLDLYCGVGLFSIALNKNNRIGFGIEIVPSAIKNAVKNAKINKLDNLKFILGDVSKVFSKINFKINTIIVDPPRKGLDKKTINKIIEVNPIKLIYISCDPITFARDLKILNTKYNIEYFYLLDAFSYTYHLELLVVLSRKN